MYPDALHYDAVQFWDQARQADRANDPTEASKYVRASVIAAFSSLEAHLNRAALSHAESHAESLEPIVRDVLREESTEIDEFGRITTRRRATSLTTRICFLAAFLSGKELDRSGKLWQDLRKAIQLRNDCVHPKPPFPFVNNPKDAEFVINTMVGVMLAISELAESTKMLHWVTAEELLGRMQAPPKVIDPLLERSLTDSKRKAMNENDGSFPGQ